MKTSHPSSVHTALATFIAAPKPPSAGKPAPGSKQPSNPEHTDPKNRIAPGHNPHKLTEEQVGAGYRLLTLHERQYDESLPDSCVPEKVPWWRSVSEFWSTLTSRWVARTFPFAPLDGLALSSTYRVRVEDRREQAPAPAPAAAPDRKRAVYVAAHFPDFYVARRVHALLERAGFEPTSTWYIDDIASAVTDLRAVAARGFAQIDRADILLLLPTAHRGTGGKYVEAGYASGKGKRVIVIGAAENWMLAGFESFATVEEWLASELDKPRTP